MPSRVEERPRLRSVEGLYLLLAKLRPVSVCGGVTGDQIPPGRLLECGVQDSVYPADARRCKAGAEEVRVEPIHVRFTENFELDPAKARDDVGLDLLAVGCVGTVRLVRSHHVREPLVQPLPDGLTLRVEHDPACRVAPRLCKRFLYFPVFSAVDRFALRPFRCVDGVAGHVEPILAFSDPVTLCRHA